MPNTGKIVIKAKIVIFALELLILNHETRVKFVIKER